MHNHLLMKAHKLTFLFITSALFLFYCINNNAQKAVATSSNTITTYSADHANLPKSFAKDFASKFSAFKKSTLCFEYTTTGLAQPILKILDEQISSSEIVIGLPRNTWGLGDVCLSITTKHDYAHPILHIVDNGTNSSFSVSNLTITSSYFSPNIFEHILQNDGNAKISLQNNYATAKFILPIIAFVLLWIGSGFIFSSCILGLGRLEVWFVTPIMGMVILSFASYLLSLAGIYNTQMLFLSVSLISYAAYTKNQETALLNNNAPVSIARTQITNSKYISLKFGYFFEVCAAILIILTACKYVNVAATPFYFNDWDAIVSWNKWGADWSLREARGNYQFTYPQMIPLLYSVYYKLAGYSAYDPLTLSMNTVHALNTFLGLLSLPLVYVCGKALNVNPITPIICVLTFRYLGMVNTGFVDTILVTYNLTCALVILRGSQVTECQSNITSFVALCLLGAGAIFLKQIGIFASLAMLLFIFIRYREVVTSKWGLFWLALVAIVPTEFYLHELLFDFYPNLADNNPLNHPIGGVISNGGAQVDIVASLSWYTILTGKMLWAIGGPWLSKWAVAGNAGTFFSLLIALGSIALYVFISYKLYKDKNWPWLILWGCMVGGQLMVGSLFGYRYDVRYIYTFIPILGFIIAIIVDKTWLTKPKKVLAWIFPISSLLILYTLLEFHPQTPAPATNGYDMISYEERLKRFFAPDFIQVENYLVALPSQHFKFSTDSTFVTWPHTIYAGRKYEATFQSGDFFYTVSQKTCPNNYTQIMITDTSIKTVGRLCRKN